MKGIFTKEIRSQIASRNLRFPHTVSEIFIYKVATLLKNVKTQYKICIFLFCVTNIQENHKTRALFFTNGSARTNIINCRRLCLYVYDCLERIDRESLELVCFCCCCKRPNCFTNISFYCRLRLLIHFLSHWRSYYQL